jgi:hypothetical protein
MCLMAAIAVAYALTGVRWKDEWVSVETFLSQRYGLNISHGISDKSMRRILTDAGLALPPRLARGEARQGAG